MALDIRRTLTAGIASVALTGVLFSGLPVPASADSNETAAQSDSAVASDNGAILVDDAYAVIEQMLQRPRFVRALKRAKAVVVFPSLLKAGYFIGGKTGSGVVVKRNEDGTWSNPAFVQIAGGSFGLQIGVSVSQVALVIQSDNAVESILDGNLELGGDFAVAIGPAAVDAGIDTSIDILSFTISNGLFAGVALEGSTIVKSLQRNHGYYGADVSTREIIVDGKVTNRHADRFRQKLAAAAGNA